MSGFGYGRISSFGGVVLAVAGLSACGPKEPPKPLPPPPVVGPVRLDSGEIVNFCVGCSPDSPIQASEIKGVPGSTQPKRRLFWLIEK